MPDSWDEHRSQERSRWRRARASSSEDLDPELTDEFDVARQDDRTLAEAERAADEKLELYMEVGKKGLIALALLIFIPPVGIILAIIWGAKYGRRVFRAFVEPKLRERLVAEEIGERVRLDLAEDRRELVGAHSRSLEKLSASIAHEIRNPITAAKSLVQQMGEEPDGVDNAEYARVALAELERVERSISHLLRYARDEDLRLVELRMADVLDSAVETFRDRAGRQGIEIACEFDCEGILRGDPEKLRRAVINLMGNAFDALEDSDVESPRVRVSMGENLAGSEVWVRIQDNGAGMDREAREGAFSPFVTHKANGTGLGLAITKKILDSHDGSIEIQSQPGAGTEFILTLPKKISNGARA